MSSEASTKVEQWLAEARQAQSSGGDASVVLHQLLAADIKSEIKATAKKKREMQEAALSRLQNDAATRAISRASQAEASSAATSSSAVAEELLAVSCGADGPGTPGDVRTYIDQSRQRGKGELLSHLGSNREFEAATINTKEAWAPVASPNSARTPSTGGEKPLPPPKDDEDSSPPAPKQLSYHELLYREGMVGKQEREKWRNEAADVLAARELQACTFRPAVSDTSKRIVAEARALGQDGGGLRLDQRTEHILAEQRLRRQRLAEVVEKQRQSESLSPSAVAAAAAAARSPPAASSSDGAGLCTSPEAEGNEAGKSVCRVSNAAFAEGLARSEQHRRARQQQAKSDTLFAMRQSHGETFKPSINPRSRAMADSRWWQQPPSRPPSARGATRKASEGSKVSHAAAAHHAAAAASKARSAAAAATASAASVNSAANAVAEPQRCARSVGSLPSSGKMGEASEAGEAATNGVLPAPPPPAPPPSAIPPPATRTRDASSFGAPPDPPDTPDPLRAFVSRLDGEVARRRLHALEAEAKAADAAREAAAPRKLSAKSEQLAKARRRVTAGLHEPTHHVSPEALAASASASGEAELTFSPTLVASDSQQRPGGRRDVYQELYAQAEEWRREKARKRLESARAAARKFTFEPATNANMSL